VAGLPTVAAVDFCPRPVDSCWYPRFQILDLHRLTHGLSDVVQSALEIGTFGFRPDAARAGAHRHRPHSRIGRGAGRRIMLRLPPSVRIFVCTQIADMHRGFD
jgi:hypothetical protein